MPPTALFPAVQRLARRTAELGGQLGGLRGRQLFLQLRVQALAFEQRGAAVVAGAANHQDEFALALVGIGADPELVEVAGAWARLSAPVKAGILAMIRSTK